VASCVQHIFETAIAQCDRCGDGLCDGCVVPVRASVLCRACALARAGVRSSGSSSRAAAARRKRVNEPAGQLVSLGVADDLPTVVPDLLGSSRRASELIRAFEDHLAGREPLTRPGDLAAPVSPVIDLRDGSAGRYWPDHPGPDSPAATPLARPSGGGTTPEERAPDRDGHGGLDRRRLLALLATGTAGAAVALGARPGPGTRPSAPVTAPGAARLTPPVPAGPGSPDVSSAASQIPPGTTGGTRLAGGGGAGASSGAGSGTASPSAPPASTPGGVTAPAPVPSPPSPPGSPSPPSPSAPTAPPASSAPPPSGPVPPAPPGSAPPATEIEVLRQARLIERITFGPTPALVDQVATLGADRFLEHQLSHPPATTAGVLSGDHLLDATFGDRYRARSTHDAIREMRHAAVVRAAHHPGQLAELMVEFWTNHLSTYSGEDDLQVQYAIATDDRDVIRRHALGRAAEMVLASARSVSMQRYLDNFRSIPDDPDQNYARELLELHTLGEGNGYDEADVAAVSRILSGWGLAGRADHGPGYTFQYQPDRHFTGPVTVGIVLPDGSEAVWSTPGRSGPAGEQDGIDFINWLTRFPNTARFISLKLARRFVSDEPSEALVTSMADVYLANDTAIVPVLRHMFTSDEFNHSRRTKVKTPFELLVAMLRATGATVDRQAGSAAAATVDAQLENLGHRLWGWPTPDGFPDERSFWVTTNSVMRRWELAGRLANGQLAGVSIDPQALLPNPLPATVGEVIVALAERLGTGVDETATSALAAFLGATHDAPVGEVHLDRDLGNLIGLLLSVPSYQFR
jgi:uncharacterized protein (DUF1800 family)